VAVFAVFVDAVFEGTAFLAAAFFVAAFFVAAFVATAFLAAVFRVAAFLALALVAVVFVAAFVAVAFVAVAFLAVAFLAVAFLAVVFVAVAFVPGALSPLVAPAAAERTVFTGLAAVFAGAACALFFPPMSLVAAPVDLPDADCCTAVFFATMAAAPSHIVILLANRAGTINRLLARGNGAHQRFARPTGAVRQACKRCAQLSAG